MITVFLAEDHAVVRQGLRELLSQEQDLSVVGETGDGLEVVPRVRELEPRVLVLDLMLPGLDGYGILRRLTDSSSTTEVVVLSMYGDPPHVHRALDHGARGYVLKEAPGEELVRAIRGAAEGRRYLAPPISVRAVREHGRRVSGARGEASADLTPREREVLHLVAEGLTAGEIGDRLGISSRTVETHRRHLREKLGARSSTELVRYAFERGLLPVDPSS